MKRVWFIAPFELERLDYIAEQLYLEGIDVLLMTSSFSHRDKKPKEISKRKEPPFLMEFINEPGYQKNVSLKRAYSHIMFAKNLKRRMKNLKKPDLIYCAYPTMTAAYFSGCYAKRNKVPFILDVIDTWPESISVAIDTKKPIVKAIMWPFSRFADKIYSMADNTFAVSETYLERARIKSGKSKSYIPVYLGTDLKKFNNKFVDNHMKKEEEIWLTYIGTLSYSYDVATIIKAFKILEEYPNIKLNILGTGPDYNQLIELANRLNVLDKNVKFYGFVEYDKVLAVLKKTDIALHALTESSLGTITLKIADYISAGLPILNSSQQKEIKELIEENKIGINYKPGDSQSLAAVILELCRDKSRRIEYGKNSKVLGEKSFDMENSHKIIIETIKDQLCI